MSSPIAAAGLYHPRQIRIKAAGMAASRTKPMLAPWLASLVVLATVGCASWRAPQIDPSGRQIFLPSESVVVPGTPAIPGAPLPQERVTLAPANLIAPVGSEVILVVGVQTAEGSLSPSERIEWLLSPESAGHFVTVGEGSGWWIFSRQNAPQKVSNHLAIGTTSSNDFTITRGTQDPTDDINVRRGQTWISITSPTEGSSVVTAFAPIVRGWQQRTASSTIHWVDAQWIFPPANVSPLGSRPRFTTTTTRQSSGLAVAGMIVRYELVGGVEASFAEGSTVVEVATDELGQAHVELVQPQPQAGTAELQITLIRPAQGKSPPLVLGTSRTTQTWSSPNLDVRVSGPSEVGTGEPLDYLIEVTNSGDLPSDNVVVSNEIPGELTVLGSNPQHTATTGKTLQWNLGQLAAGETRSLQLRLRSDVAGTVQNCARAESANGMRASDCATTTVTQRQVLAPQLDVRIQGPATAVVGDDVRFRVIVSNRGDATATNLTALDEYDAGFRHVVQNEDRRVERDLPDIPGGQPYEFPLNFRALEAGRQCHTLTVTGAGNLSATATACVNVVAREPAPPVQPDRPSIESSPQDSSPPAGTPPRSLFPDSDAPLSGDPRSSDDSSATTEPPLGTPFALPGAATSENGSPTPDAQPPGEGSSPAQNLTPPPRPSPGGLAEEPLRVSIVPLDEPIQSGGKARYQIVVTNSSGSPARNVQLTVQFPLGMTPTPGGTKAPPSTSPPQFVDRQVIFDTVPVVQPEDSLFFFVIAETSRPGQMQIEVKLTSDDLREPVTSSTRNRVLEATD